MIKSIFSHTHARTHLAILNAFNEVGEILHFDSIHRDDLLWQFKVIEAVWWTMRRETLKGENAPDIDFIGEHFHDHDDLLPLDALCVSVKHSTDL